uniref:50S ribosomal protein L12, chloroplastic n=1 Tax=Apophlaea sinclairii TaxID=212746 RepID=A0A1C9CBQ0_9FLOR|nr:ribosomal protein L12 [Apophlaea sinclairii]AOM65823.1 ribosomal protein L12 [Apophlaea sinclairii]
MATKVETIIEDLKSLTLIEAARLIKQIESTFDVDTNVTPITGSQPITPSFDSGSKEVEEQTEFSIILEEVPSTKKIAILKVVRSLTGLGLKDAKSLVESCPKALKENASKNEVDDIQKKLEEVGAKVIIK